MEAIFEAEFAGVFEHAWPVFLERLDIEAGAAALPLCQRSSRDRGPHSSSLANANFTTDGVDVAVRNLAVQPGDDPGLLIERLVELSLVPVCSPRLYEQHGSPRTAEALARLPLIHDDSLASRAKMPTWTDWFNAAGLSSIDVSRGLHFNSSDHALDAAGEGAGVLLGHDLLAYDDSRTGRLIIPVAQPISSNRAYYVVCPKHRSTVPQVRAFRDWIKQEVAALDWTTIRGKARPASSGKSQRTWPG